MSVKRKEIRDLVGIGEREKGKGVRERSGFLRVYQSEDVGCYQENHHERHCVEKPWPQRR